MTPQQEAASFGERGGVLAAGVRDLRGAGEAASAGLVAFAFSVVFDRLFICVTMQI